MRWPRLRLTLRTVLAVPILIGAGFFFTDCVSTRRKNYTYTELASVLVVDARTALPIPGAVVALTTRNVASEEGDDPDKGQFLDEDGPRFTTNRTALPRQSAWSQTADKRGIASMSVEMLVEIRSSLLRGRTVKDLQDYDLRISARGYEESSVRLNDQRRGRSQGSFFDDPIEIRLKTSRAAKSE